MSEMKDKRNDVYSANIFLKHNTMKLWICIMGYLNHYKISDIFIIYFINVLRLVTLNQSYIVLFADDTVIWGNDEEEI